MMRIRTNYLMALNVPLYHGMTNLPLLITEDDVVFAPNFNARLSSVIWQATVPPHLLTANTSAPNPYFVNLYTGGQVMNITFARSQWGGLGRGDKRWSDRGVDATRVLPDRWIYGTQALLFSPSVVPGLRAFFADALQNKELPHLQPGMWQDYVARAFTKMFSIPTYTTEPSLVEHVGAASSLFGNQAHNAKFHRANSFPFKAELPGDDVDGTW